MRESDIERHLVRRAKELGGQVRKVKWLDRRGAPDRLVMLPEKMGPAGVMRRRSFWVELKATGVKPEDYQVREHGRMRRMGEPVFVVDSIDQVEALLA